VSLPAAFAASATDSCGPLLDPGAQEEVREVQYYLFTNSFNTERDLQVYEALFGPSFRKKLRTFKSRQRWLDAGAGKARAMTDFSRRYRRREREKPLPALVAVGVKKPEDIAPSLLDQRRFRYLEGRFIEDIPDNELGHFDVITDLYGPFSYSTDISLILRKYLSLLRPGGVIYLAASFNRSMKESDPEFIGPGLRRTTVLDENGHALSMEEWFDRIAGIEVKKTSPPGFINETYEIRRLSGAPLPEISPLKLIHFKAHKPPERLFETTKSLTER
jgi:SAM-dependent methyltransferase